MNANASSNRDKIFHFTQVEQKTGKQEKLLTIYEFIDRKIYSILFLFFDYEFQAVALAFFMVAVLKPQYRSKLSILSLLGSEKARNLFAVLTGSRK